MTLHSVKNKNLIWLKSTKVAGSSLRYSIGDSNISIYNYKTIDNTKSVILVYDYMIDFFKKQFPELWESSYKFNVVRNPYNKVVSGWKYHPYTRNKTLEECLRKLTPPDPHPRSFDFYSALNGSKLDYYSAYIHTTYPQSYVSKQMNLTIYYENINVDIKKIFPNLNLLHENKSNNFNDCYLSFHNEATIELTNQIFKEDFDCLNYTMIKK